MKTEDIDEHKMKNIKLFSVGPDLASALPVFLLSLSLSSFLLSGSTSLPKSLYVCISPPPSPPSQSYHQNPHPFSYPLTSSTSSIYISHNILIHIYLLTLSLPMSALACCCLLRPQAPRPLLYVVSSNISLSQFNEKRRKKWKNDLQSSAVERGGCAPSPYLGQIPLC